MKYNGFAAKTVMITGASKGIGKEIARELSNSGCKLILTASSANSFDGFDIEAEGIKFLHFDMSKELEVLGALEKLNRLNAYPDILINNAGIGIFKDFINFNFDDINSTININYKSPILITQSLLPKMLESGFGVIANVISVAAINNFSRSTIYGSSKAALLEAMKTLRLEVRKSGIKIINFIPGATNTAIWSPKVRSEYGEVMMSPESLAKVIVSSIDNAITHNLMIEEMSIRPQNGDL